MFFSSFPVGRSVEVDATFGRHDMRYAVRELAEVHVAQGLRIYDVNGTVLLLYFGTVLTAGVQSVSLAYVHVSVGVGLEEVVVGVHA